MIDVFNDKWREIIKAMAETTDFEESRIHTSHEERLRERSIYI